MKTACLKRMAAVLAAAVAVSGCAGGAGFGETKKETENGAERDAPRRRYSADMPHSYGPLADPDLSPFPRDAVRRLDERPGQGMLRFYQADQPVVVPYVSEGGERYVPLDTLVALLEFEHFEAGDDGVIKIGDKDVVFQLTDGKTEAEKEGEPFTLAAPPKRIGGRWMLTAASAADLLAEEMVFELAPEGLVLFPSDNGIPPTLRDTDEEIETGEELDPSLDFADDPLDPFKGDGGDALSALANLPDGTYTLEQLEALAGGPEAVPVLKDFDINALIRTAKKYLGVKYRFGAAPYPQSNRFDCSSFTQYVYGKYGIELPRTARAQSRIGKTVSRKKLRKGDLLFFYVPGRFKSNKIAGHVGIYIGNRKMIHANTEPKNGVQIRSIDRAFWKKTFLKAKRVAY